MSNVCGWNLTKLLNAHLWKSSSTSSWSPTKVIWHNCNWRKKSSLWNAWLEKFTTRQAVSGVGCYIRDTLCPKIVWSWEISSLLLPISFSFFIGRSWNTSIKWHLQLSLGLFSKAKECWFHLLVRIGFYRTRVRSLFTLVSNWLTNWLTNWLPNSCLVNLIDVTLACEDANSKLVDVVTVADEDHAGNNLLQISKLRFGQKTKLCLPLSVTDWLTDWLTDSLTPV